VKIVRRFGHDDCPPNPSAIMDCRVKAGNDIIEPND